MSVRFNMTGLAVVGVTAYIKETRFHHLEAQVPYDKPRSETPLYGISNAPSITLERLPACADPRRLERLPEPELFLRHSGQSFQTTTNRRKC